MDIKISDIFNITITHPKKRFNKDYIIINIVNENVDYYLTPINQYNGVYIYKLKRDGRIIESFKKVGLNIDDYIELGNYIIYDTNNIQILLINKNNSNITNRYTLLTTIGQLYIWKPISMNNNYINLGVICTTNPNDIPNDYIGLVPREHVKIFENSSAELFQNDYNLLGSNRDNKKKLISSNILNNTPSENDSQAENNENDSQAENNNKIEHFEGDWTQYRGNKLVLVEAENPWYVNKENTIPVKYIHNHNFFIDKNIQKLQNTPTIPNAYQNTPDNVNNNATYVSNVVLDTSKPSLGFGYSFAGRNVEQFNEKSSSNKDNSNYVIIIMFIAIILLFGYNIYYKKSHKKYF